ncbi:MAG: hydroxymethylbilane synthase [Firmicutes bacterium]|nr:hydroxymethylbilane synthase [Bacillota bacterium]
MGKTVRVATRGSLLALSQTRWVVARLEALHPGVRFAIEIYRTQGDRTQAAGIPLSQVGGKGLFTKELEEALLDGRADLAVHSLKDMPTELPPGLTLGCIPEREDPRDVVIARDGTPLAELPPGAVVGTSSLRRLAQLRRLRPDLEYRPVRGNVDTRLRKLEEGQFDALVMAAAGLHRAGFAGRITEYLDPRVLLPAVGQGALALEIRAGDEEMARLLAPLHHLPTALAVRAERAFMARITREAQAVAGLAGAQPLAGPEEARPLAPGAAAVAGSAGPGAPGRAPALAGSCQTPVAAHARLAGDRLHLRGLVALPDGSRIAAWEAEGAPEDPEGLGTRVAEQVLALGGREVLEQIHRGG